MTNDGETTTWSNSGVATAGIAVAAMAAGWYVASVPVRLAPATLVTVGLAAIGGVIVIARSRMPAFARAALLMAGCGSLLTCFATQDLLGIRAVEARTAAAVEEGQGGAPTAIRSTAAVTITTDDPAARAVAERATSIATARLSEGDVGVTGKVSIGPDQSYRLNWSLVRGGDRLWCGVHTETPRPGAPAFAGFGDRLAAAAARSRGGALDCT